MLDTIKEIKRQADHGIDSKNMDAQSLRKVLVNIANLAHAELEAPQVKSQYDLTDRHTGPHCRAC